MEGTLCVPPERGTIIGRAIWKPRYVVVGGAQREQQTQSPSLGSLRLPSSRSSTPKGQLQALPDAIFLSVYKSKDDWEPIQQHAIGTITDCQVQMVAHRKQGPVLPTLIINIVPDPLTDKLRKRRSSRTAGLTATKETAPTSLWFRTVDEQHTLQDWARFIQQLIQPNVPDTGPLSPLTPASPTFINPFAPRSRDPSEAHRPNSRPAFHSKGSNQTQSSRERPLTYSESTSLRSKRSDLSSHASSMNPSHIGFQNYTTLHPTDLPSPATTIGEYQGEFIEGWTSAQGRSSTLSSPVRGRDSIGSQIPAPIQPTMEASSPPGPRETILDRAFQLRCIPGSEYEVPGEEKLSSLARFDALMREADDKRWRREAEEARIRAARAPTVPKRAEPKSAWDMDNESDSDDEPDFDERDDDSDGPVGEMEREPTDYFNASSRSEIPTPASRALSYIAGRHASAGAREQLTRSQSHLSPASYQHDDIQEMFSNSGSYQVRPQTGYSKNRSRPAMAQRIHSTPQLAGVITRPSTTPPVPSLPPSGTLKIPTSLSSKSAEDGVQGVDGVPVGPGSHRSATEKRLSASSTKRLSFTEFTKRLSSTSSLLLVQTNASGTSSRGSNSDLDAVQHQQQQTQQHYHHLYPRAAPSPPQQQQQPQHQQPQGYQAPGSGDRDRERCGWRGSVGVFGSAEGGFL
ncbi:hypothetical protein B0H66DRAFT_154060 [Apodospora peruviana]|uniref:Uncharacterized protein n=1 Tax=Apodospora peruviana TaxID=516989 RepID=A0AAE0MBF1_9PEZI|nr:hypothetical protein B0H66DRAFT_154060 [Apodospora peruviana]